MGNGHRKNERIVARLLFQEEEWNNIETWRIAAKNRVLESIASPYLGEMPE